MGIMMDRRTGTATMLASFMTLFGGRARAQAPQAPAFSGRWGGIIGPAATGLRVVLEIDGAAAPVLVSVDQGGARIPATGGSVDGGRLVLLFGAVRGRLEVDRIDASSLSGTWNQRQAIPLTLTLLAPGQTAPARPVEQRGTMREEIAKGLAAASAPALGGAWAGRQGEDVAVDGLRAAGGAVNVTPDDAWHIGSVTKSMTATMLARLVQRGTLSWNQTVVQSLGEQVRDIHPALRTVTLAQLVTGRSGLASNPGMVHFLTYPRREQDPRASRIRWARHVLSQAPEAAPGTRFIYPNTGFVVAGAIAEAATGQSWEALMRTEVFEPLALASAGFGPPASSSHPSGHSPSGQRYIPVASTAAGADNPAVMGPAGTVHMTLGDLARFASVHAMGDAGTGFQDYLPRDAWRALHTPPDGLDSYAFGLVQRDGGLLWHNGSNTLWYCEMAIDPAAGVGACAVANTADSEAAVGAVLEAALQAARA